MNEQPGLPKAGWYQDPEGDQGRLRYWDGERWTDHYHRPVTASEAKPESGSRLLTVGAGVYFALAWLVAVLGGLGVIIAATQADDDPTGFDNADPAAIVIFGGLYVAFFALSLFVYAALIRKVLAVDETTRRTEAAIRQLSESRSGCAESRSG
jgi:cytochrome c biogenesis protein CcdA